MDGKNYKIWAMERGKRQDDGFPAKKELVFAAAVGYNKMIQISESSNRSIKLPGGLLWLLHAADGRATGKRADCSARFRALPSSFPLSCPRGMTV
jgi:hypothetical protein